MLSPVDPSLPDNQALAHPALAYPVPFRFDRSAAPRYALTNLSLERLTGIRFALLGPGRMPLQAPTTLDPGATTWLPITGADLAQSTILIVRWARENGDEYLWRASF